MSEVAEQPKKAESPAKAVADPQCPICKRYIAVNYHIQDHGKVIPWYHCFCGTMFHLNGIDRQHFNAKYLEKWQNEVKGAKERYEYLTRTYIPIIEDMTYGRKFLDVGFTLPHNIKNLSKRGWVATGIDLVKNDYITGDFEDYKFPERTTFDFILFGHVLESFRDPVKAIKKAHDLLNDKGVLMITTPNPELIFTTGLKDFGHWIWKEKWIFISEPELKRITQRIGFKWIIGRRNLSQRYISWNDLHVILQKEG